VCCSVLQCVVVCCSVLQCAAVCCSALQCFAVRCSVLQCVAVCCSARRRHEQIIIDFVSMISSSAHRRLEQMMCVLQCVAVCCSALQCFAVCCSVLQFSQEARANNYTLCFNDVWASSRELNR
jgi:hypothetical protein